MRHTSRFKNTENQVTSMLLLLMKLMPFVNQEVMTNGYMTLPYYYYYNFVVGKSDHSAASVAYDSLVNQLLTLMDGLRLLIVIKG